MATLCPCWPQWAPCTDQRTTEHLRQVRGSRVLARADGTLLALFDSLYQLERLEKNHPDWRLDPVLSAGDMT